MFLGIIGFILSIWLIVALLALAILAFEVWMIVSAIQNQAISNESRILWIIGMLLIHPIVAIIYYFTDHQKAR